MTLSELEKTLDIISKIDTDVKVDIINHQLIFTSPRTHTATTLLKRSIEVLLPMIIAQFKSEVAEKRRQTEVQLKYACERKIKELE